MTTLPQARAEDRSPDSLDTTDPVLTSLAHTATLYRTVRSQAEEARAELARLQDALAAATARVQAAEAAGAAAERQAEQQRRHADHLRAELKAIHQAVFTGNIYGLILKVCLTLTGATRGMYITASGEADHLRVRAAVDMDGYPRNPPSPRIEALCRHVLADNSTFMCSDDAALAAFPTPNRPAEEFRNCLIAPVVLLRNFDGIVLLADKAGGDFSHTDVEMILNVGDQSLVAVENDRLRRELQHAYLGTVTMLADTMEAKDPYTQGHCEQVSRLARLTAAELHLSDHDRSVVCYAALLHDIGKIGVSDGVLNKTGPLMPEERDLMRAHVRVGHDLVAKVPALESIGQAVLRHHEWYDGNGYPDGLCGDEIPIAARVVSVVDAYCAMITKRSYKEAYTDEYARAELRHCAGTQFDPQVVAAFLLVLDWPEAQDLDDDDEAECGLLPQFTATSAA
ncbi:MAG: HD-GYP domain-containing protein [Chloroflexota bacterium]|nr:HD-GYP domain-containing protein [Chloroflexota bacterium]